MKSTKQFKIEAARIVANLVEYYSQYGFRPDAFGIIEITNTFRELQTEIGISKAITREERRYKMYDEPEELKEIIEDLKNLMDYEKYFHTSEYYNARDLYGNEIKVYSMAPIISEDGDYTGRRFRDTNDRDIDFYYPRPSAEDTMVAIQDGKIITVLSEDLIEDFDEDDKEDI